MSASDYYSGSAPAIVPDYAAFATHISPDNLAVRLAALYPSETCDTLLAVVQQTVVPPFVTAPNGTYAVPTDLSFIVPTAPPADLTSAYIVTLNQTGGPNVASYTFNFNADGSKNILSITINNSTVLFDASNYVTIFSSTDTNSPFNCVMPWTRYTAVDAPGFLGFAVPACAISPPVALPVVGDAIKSANFTKLFNPLGISLKDI